MRWVYFAALSASCWGILSVIAKKILDDTPALIYTLIYSLIALGFYTPISIYYLTSIQLNYTLIALAVLTVSITGNILGFIVFNYSVKEGELSQVVPIRRLTPIFTAVIAGLLLKESLDFTAATGILMATAGAVIVLKEDHVSYLKSAEEELKNKAIKAALLSSLIYGFVSTADRYATQIIPPEFYTQLVFIGMASGFTAASYKKYPRTGKEVIEQLKKHKLLYLLTGAIAATGTFTVFQAFSMASAAKVTTTLQLQVLIPVIAGVLLFKEDGLARKLVGSLILVTGVALTAI